MCGYLFKMKYDFININGAIKRSLRFLFFIILFQSPVFPQTISNLDVFYSLTDSASHSLLSDLGDIKKIDLLFDLGIDYPVFANRIRGELLRNGIGFSPDNSGSAKVNFVIDNAQVNYSEPRKNGIFGDFFTERSIKLSGNYFIPEKSKVNKFVFTAKDTVRVDDIEEIENRSFPFTQGEIPPEPFFSSLLEPVVALGTAAVTVILFFSVRSK